MTQQNNTSKTFEEFDQWNDVTGCFVKNSSWYFEVQSIIKDSFKAGERSMELQIEKMKNCLNCNHEPVSGFHCMNCSRSYISQNNKDLWELKK